MGNIQKARNRLFVTRRPIRRKSSPVLFQYFPGFQAGATFTRSSTATYLDRNEVLQEAASGVLRDDHWVEDEGGILVRSTLLEGARTNLLTRSEGFDHGDWGSGGTPVVTANDATAPDGTTTADKIEDDDSGAIEWKQQVVTIADDSDDYVLSFFIRKKGGDDFASIVLNLFGGTGVEARVALNVSTGATIANGPASSHGVEDINDDWWRLWVVATNNGTGNTNAQCIFFPAHADSLTTSQSDSPTGHQHIWGAQLEEGSFPTSYIPTTGSPISRAADNLSFPYPHPPQSMTVYCKFRELGSIGNNYPRIWQIGESSAEFMANVSASAGKYRVETDGGGLSSVSLTTGPSIGDVVEVVAQVEASTFRGFQSINGGAAESTPDGAHTMSAAFSDPTIYVSSEQGGTQKATAPFIAGPIVAKGVKTMDQMRALAGV